MKCQQTFFIQSSAGIKCHIYDCSNYLNKSHLVWNTFKYKPGVCVCDLWVFVPGHHTAWNPSVYNTIPCRFPTTYITTDGDQSEDRSEWRVAASRCSLPLTSTFYPPLSLSSGASALYTQALCCPQPVRSLSATGYPLLSPRLYLPPVPCVCCFSLLTVSDHLQCNVLLLNPVGFNLMPAWKPCCKPLCRGSLSLCHVK